MDDDTCRVAVPRRGRDDRLTAPAAVTLPESVVCVSVLLGKIPFYLLFSITVILLVGLCS